MAKRPLASIAKAEGPVNTTLVTVLARFFRLIPLFTNFIVDLARSALGR